MDASEVRSRRLVTQQLTGPRAATATDVVRRLACVQSQEHAHAFWSLGMRTDGLDQAAVRAEFDAGSFVRTHILRPTWHYVAAEDLRWITAVTTDRVQRLNGSVLRREGLDLDAVRRGVDVVAQALADHTYLTRAELGGVLAAAGLPGQGFGQIYIVMQSELDAVVCSGPMRGGTHTYALMDERVPRAVDAEGDEAELARRFFVGHGPASVRDLARWSSLTLTTCRRAVQAVADRLESVEVDGETLWFDPELTATPVRGGAWLVPLYDELTLTYPALGFPKADGHPHQPGVDVFVGSVICDDVNVGSWRRELKGPGVEVALILTPGVTARQRAEIDDAVTALARFLDRPLTLSVTTAAG